MIEPAEPLGLVGSCVKCGIVNAVDLNDTPANRKYMARHGRIVRSVPQSHARKAFKRGGDCGCVYDSEVIEYNPSL